MQDRQCTKCLKVKPLSEFGRKSKFPDGIARQCKQCNRDYQKQNYRTHPEKKREESRDNLRRIRSTEEGRSRQSQIAKKCWDNGRDKRQKVYNQTFMDKHFFAWRARQWSAKYHVKITAQDLARLWKKQSGKCALSGRKLGRDAHLDHIIHTSKDGSHTLDNIRWLDPFVNVARGNMTDEEFVAMCQQICERSEYVGRCILAAIEEEVAVS